MYFSATQFLTLALAGYTAAAPNSINNIKRARSAVIGYRTVSKGEAEQIADYGTFVHENDYFSDEKAQTGLGKYLSPVPGDWPGQGSGDWYCIVWADAGMYERISKVWIPEDAWWPNSEQQMKDYISSVGADARLSLRYSEISGKPGILQMMIPRELFNQYAEENGLDIEVQCFPSVGELTRVERQRADYMRGDIKNKAGPANPTPPNPAAPPPPPGPPGRGRV